MTKRILQVLIPVALLAMLASTVGAQDAKRGEALYNEYTCYGCHGFSGQNGPGAKLAPMNMPQVVFTAYVRNPGRPNQMPPYSTKTISDAQLGDIWAYLKTLKDAPAADDIDLLQDIKDEVTGK